MRVPSFAHSLRIKFPVKALPLSDSSLSGCPERQIHSRYSVSATVADDSSFIGVAQQRRVRASAITRTVVYPSFDGCVIVNTPTLTAAPRCDAGHRPNSPELLGRLNRSIAHTEQLSRLIWQSARIDGHQKRDANLSTVHNKPKCPCSEFPYECRSTIFRKHLGTKLREPA